MVSTAASDVSSCFAEDAHYIWPFTSAALMLLRGLSGPPGKTVDIIISTSGILAKRSHLTLTVMECSYSKYSKEHFNMLWTNNFYIFEVIYVPIDVRLTGMLGKGGAMVEGCGR